MLTEEMFTFIINDRDLYFEIYDLIKESGTVDANHLLVKINAVKGRLRRKGHITSSDKCHAFQLLYDLANYWEISHKLNPAIKTYVENNYDVDGQFIKYGENSEKVKETELKTISKPIKVKETIMKFETRQFVNNSDVADLSKEDLIETISSAQQQLKDYEETADNLEKLKMPSKAINNKIKKLKEFIGSVVKVLDTK